MFASFFIGMMDPRVLDLADYLMNKLVDSHVCGETSLACGVGMIPIRGSTFVANSGDALLLSLFIKPSFLLTGQACYEAVSLWSKVRDQC